MTIHMNNGHTGLLPHSPSGQAPASQGLEQVFDNTFSLYIRPSDTLILAVSGGVDSMVLFDMVRQIHPKDQIIVAHFDHSLRGGDSDNDRDLVANICKKYGIIFELEKMDIGTLAKQEKSSLEAVARRERYRFLEMMRQKYHAKYILTGHHMDDQVETILMGMLKGGKRRGLSGMSTLSHTSHEIVSYSPERYSPKRSKETLYRPLLEIRKSEILEYAKDRNIVYHEDSTNSDIHYMRNKIRHALIPVLRDIEPNIDIMMSELGIYMQELGELIEIRVETWLRAQTMMTQIENSFLIRFFVSEPIFFQREIISFLYNNAHGGSTQGLSRGNIQECIRFISEASNSHGIKEIKKMHLERRGEIIYYQSLQS